MKGSEQKILDFLEGNNKRFIIPVYQRKYEWKADNCLQLYNDLKKIVLEGRNSHFFGSIVSAVVGNGAKTEHHIVDGQQRLTTISLLLLAISDLISEGRVTSAGDRLEEQIRNTFLIAQYGKDDDKIKLRPVKEDREALKRLFGSPEDYDKTSQLTSNYQLFRGMILKEEVSVDALYEAISKLEIISITLDSGDNAQRIFESLNSTGLALTEGDKIRNYILMGLSPQEQNEFYDNYWTKIENCTAGDISGFVRDYLSIKQQTTPTIGDVYRAFKNYSEYAGKTAEDLLKDLLAYARLYEKLLTGRSGLNSRKLDDCLYRMKRLEIGVTRPFLMEVLRLNQNGHLTLDDITSVFLITETYLFRRNICDVPTNALSKIFVGLNREILQYDNTANDYVNKFIYALLSKEESGRFPDDDEFTRALSVKQVYQMRGQYKPYLFERFENYGTVETKDVYQHLDSKVYTIEHIMPQHLTPAWIEALGENYEEIHDTWLHRLANLTLTGYNPSLSNYPFVEKRDAPEGGYRDSGLRMNQKIATKESWGLSELEERDREMTELAKTIWPLPKTDFVAPKREFSTFSLEDEIDMSGERIVRYSYQDIERPVKNWSEMFVQVIRYLHERDRGILQKLIYNDTDEAGLARYFSRTKEGLRSALELDENIFVETNTSTMMKLSILRKLFNVYGVDPMDLVFYFGDVEREKETESARVVWRQRYWSYAIPIIRSQSLNRMMFRKAGTTKENTIYGYFRHSGRHVSCTANYNEAYVEFYLGDDHAKETYDVLFLHREEIDRQVGEPLKWERADGKIASWISLKLQDVSITNEADWPRMARFHAEMAERLCRVILPYCLPENEMRALEIAAIKLDWAACKDGVTEAVANSSPSHIRFTTPGMTEILPPIESAPSDWGTDNHYFYAIVNGSKNRLTVHLVINSKNITPEFRQTCDRINEFYPSKFSPEDWRYRVPFSTGVTIEGELSKEAIFAGLDKCLNEILAFEAELKGKLANPTR